MLLVGFSAVLRRSELVALTVDDITFVPEGAVVRICRSKTDQEPRGESVAIILGKLPKRVLYGTEHAALDIRHHQPRTTAFVVPIRFLIDTSLEASYTV